MDNANECCSTQLIDGDGVFNFDGLELFITEVHSRECGLSHALVSFMGPLSSGKSRLLNNLFHTNFREMDAYKGRFQTTKGMWLVKAAGIEPCTLGMDLEGTGGRERGEIWENVPQPQDHKETPVQVVVLPSFEEKEELFKEQVASLRQQFFHSVAPGWIAGGRLGVVPASGFSFNAHQIWKVIKENNNLDLPRNKVMIASVRCVEIAHKMFNNVSENEEWHHQEEAAQTGPVPGFRGKFSSVIGTCLSGCGMEATYFDEGVRTSKQNELEERLLQAVQPAFRSVLVHIRSGTLDKLKEAFNEPLNGGEECSSGAHSCSQHYTALFEEACTDAVFKRAKWDTLKKFWHNVVAHIASVLAVTLYALTLPYEEMRSSGALAGPVRDPLDERNERTWLSVRNLLRREAESTVYGFSGVLSGFDIDELSKEEMLSSLQDYEKGVVEGKAREEAGWVLIRMKDRLSTWFSHDNDSKPRVWTGKEDIRAVTKTARSVIWDNILKPQAHKGSLLRELFNVQVVALSSFEEKQELFKEQVASLRQQFFNSIAPGDITGGRWVVVPASGFSFSAQQIWKAIKENKDLDLSGHKVMVPNVLSKGVAQEKFNSFVENEEWRHLEKAAQTGPVPGFGGKICSIIGACLSGFGTEDTYVDEGVRTLKKKQLQESLLGVR